VISQTLDATTAKRMKTSPYCQRRNCSPLNVLFSDVYIIILTLLGVPLLGSTIRIE